MFHFVNFFPFVSCYVYNFLVCFFSKLSLYNNLNYFKWYVDILLLCLQLLSLEKLNKLLFF